MEGLRAEKKKREKELEVLRTSEPKLIREIAGLKESMQRMRREINVSLINAFTPIGGSNVLSYIYII
jgi:hypothetical protein